MYNRMWMLLLILLISHLSKTTSQCGSSGEDQQDKLALYKITFNTYWTQMRFSEYYPDWRYPLQFGKLVGRTHDKNYSLYRLGTRLNSGVIYYVQTGRIDGLDSNGGDLRVLDTFYGSEIPRSDGFTTTQAFFDGNHTLVSIISRISPSRDLFVGIDSFQLCIHRNWVDTVTVELDPLSAGADNSYTFVGKTPKSTPQKVAYRITPQLYAYPIVKHYSHSGRLSPIATVTFTKIKEYTLSDIFHNDEIAVEFVSNDHLPPREQTIYENVKEVATENKNGADSQKYRYSTTGKSQLTKLEDTTNNPKAVIINGIASSYYIPVQEPSASTLNLGLKGGRRNHFLNPPKKPIRKVSNYHYKTHEKVADITDNSTWLKNKMIFSGQESYYKLQIRNNHKFKLKGRRYKERISRDCKVGDWSAWAACSRSCGVGETQRIRKIIIKSRRGGKPCPNLKETKWCGSATPCFDNYKLMVNFSGNSLFVT